MGAIDSFMTTWSNARQTMGEGSPQEGAPFDKSSQLRQMQSTVQSAAPAGRWTGSAADSYADANSKQGQVLGQMAGLDQRLGTEVDRSAAVVAAGRQNLDGVKQWVLDAAASVPASESREQQLLPIARKGIGDVANVVKQTNGDLNTIGGRIKAIGNEYKKLGDDQKAGGAADNVLAPKPAAPPPRPGDMSSGDVTAIDQANRQLLDEMEQEYSKLPPGQVRTDRLADIAGIRNALKVPDSHLIYVEKPGDPSQMIPAATSVGDPFKADHVSVTVPGVSSTTRASLENMTKEAAGLRNEAAAVASANKLPDTTATIAWMGYQPPPSLFSSEVLSDDVARANAPKLESFLSNLNSASTNPHHTTALFGHSYGSLLAGIALKDGASANVTNAVMYGSPGFEATSPAQLGLSDSHFFVMSTKDDPINGIAEKAPWHGWGSDPNDVIHNDDYTQRYRFTHLDTEAGPVRMGDDNIVNKTGASGHSEYGRDPQQRMTGYNLATILLNRSDLAVEAFPP